MHRDKRSVEVLMRDRRSKGAGSRQDSSRPSRIARGGVSRVWLLLESETPDKLLGFLALGRAKILLCCRELKN